MFGVDGAAVLAKHEFSAATMADGYSRGGAGPGSGLGIVAATSGGGRNGSLDAEAVFSGVSVWCEQVLMPENIVAALSRAIAAARTGGPAVLLLPKDIQQTYIKIPVILDGHDRAVLRPRVATVPDAKDVGHPSTSPISAGLRRWTSTARRWSASNAAPTKYRPSHHFSMAHQLKSPF